jgi:hypothetical protein
MGHSVAAHDLRYCARMAIRMVTGPGLFWTQTQAGEDSVLIRLAQRYAGYLPDGVRLSEATREQVITACMTGIRSTCGSAT